LISRLIARHDPEDFEDAPVDRRLALRLPADERPFEAYCDGLEPQTIWMEDVSRSGMRFRSQCAFACGTPVVVIAPEGFKLSPVQVRIVRAQMVDPLLPERGFEYGGEYLESDDQPHAWYLGTRARR
jgi:hypothetical protein